jgi:hypothetical protein
MLQARRVANFGLRNVALLLLAWSTRRASQSAALSGFDLGHVRLLSWLHLYSFQQREMDQRMADAPANPK